MKTLIAAGVLSLSTIGIVACFSQRAPTDAGSNSTGGCVAPANTAGATIIFIKAFTFQPATVHVKAGGSVAWVNCEPTAIPHTSSADGGAWRSPLLQPTNDFVRSFTTAGTFPYHCDVHPSMKATVIVD